MTYVPFEHGSSLQLRKLYPHAPDHLEVKVVTLLSDNDLSKIDLTKDVHYYIPWKAKLSVDYEDKNYRKLLKEAFSSRKKVKLLDLPDDMPSIALHVRVGSGTDNLSQTIDAPDKSSQQKKGRTTDKLFPGKFPSLSYYCEQIKHICKMLDNQHVYVHIFTDSERPEALVQSLKRTLSLDTVHFSYIKSKERSFYGVVEDFINLCRFEYIIRPRSWFSIMAEAVADWKISISPHKDGYIWQDNKIHITHVRTLVRDGDSVSTIEL
ncbi:hypothetical protein KC622_01780 [Candidatus Dojkabacteria bacterium]|uniref:Uncharacterized protein n=1 Tax=Candidatus Dojkabacteria bacterium TaxID=2099670 RepID=A0A955HXW5_9BACT|nr:hypothetical protein [Candidatus Dojkabacteria bacterium]